MLKPHFWIIMIKSRVKPFEQSLNTYKCLYIFISFMKLLADAHGQKEYSEMLRTKRVPLNIWTYTGKMGILWHFSNEAVASCEKEES